MKKLTNKEAEELTKKWHRENGCEECKNYGDRIITCRSDCLGRYLDFIDSNNYG